MIRNIDKLKNQIIEWMRQQNKAAGATCFIIPASPQFNNSYLDVAYDLASQAGDVYRSESAHTDVFDLVAWAVRTANNKNGLIVGGLSREIIFARSYHKYGMGAVDILPLGELYHKEICQLYGKDIPEPVIRELPASMVEWVDRENNRTHIIVAKESPNTSRVWFRYTLPQKEALSKLYQFEKLTRHKALSKPVFPAMNSEFIQ